MFGRIFRILAKPRQFSADLPLPGETIWLLVALFALTLAAGGAANLAWGPREPMLVGASPWVPATGLLAGAVLTAAFTFAIPWLVVRVVGGRSVFAWSIAGATLAPATVLAVVSALATILVPQRYATHIGTLLGLADAAWVSLIVYLGTRASAPERGGLAAATYAAVVIFFTLYSRS